MVQKGGSSDPYDPPLDPPLLAILVNVLFEALNITKNAIKEGRHEVTKFAVNEVNVHIKGTLTVIGNVAESSIMQFHLCDIIMSGKILFDTNYCNEIISLDIYIKVMEHTNITFVNNRYHNKLITVRSIEKYHRPHPTCLFQYVAINNNIKTKDLPTHYTIILLVIILIFSTSIHHAYKLTVAL